MCTKLIAALFFVGALVCASPARAQSSGVPLPWQWTDVGDVGTPGTVVVGPNNDWHVSGAGSNIWGTADSFVYVYQPIRDGAIFADVDSETNTSPFAKAGVMIRQSLDPGSPEVILDVKPDGGIEFMKRSTPGGETTFIAGGSVPVTDDGSGGVNVKVILQLARLGNVVYAAYCTTECTTIGSTDFVDAPGFIGVAVTSQNPSRLNTAFFRTPPTVNAVPYPWSTVDVGPATIPDYATYNDATGTFFVSGAGSNIWGTADSFRAVTQGLFGDSQLTARVVSEDSTNTFAKAGLMMSTDASQDAARVILDVKPDGGIEFMARSASGASMSFIAGSTVTFPVWLRLTRTGDEFVGAVSQDGTTWTTVGSVTVAMHSSNLFDSIEGGLAVTSQDPSELNNVIFDNVAVDTGTIGPVGSNLLVNAGFENSVVPGVAPGWVSDTPLRQTPAVSETADPHSGAQNAACRTTSGDCGIYQEVSGTSGNLLFSVYAKADHPGALVGVTVNGQTVAGARVFVGGYQRYTMAFCTCSITSSNPVVRVWMYTPPGVAAEIDDAELAEYFGPR